VNKAVVEQTSSGAAVSVRVEPRRQVDQVDVHWRRVDGKHPRGHVTGGHREAEGAEQGGVLDALTTTGPRRDDRHHPVASTRVVGAQVPAQCTEMWKLPRVHDTGQQARTCHNHHTSTHHYTTRLLQIHYLQPRHALQWDIHWTPIYYRPSATIQRSMDIHWTHLAITS